MAYVIVDANTRCSVRHPRTGKERYKTRAAAQAAATRMLNEGVLARLKDNATRMPTAVEIMDVAAYNAQVPMVEVTNLMTGKKVMERADTPWSCSVGSESYWSS
jgi:molecular chaperone DnaK (HSP70)